MSYQRNFSKSITVRYSGSVSYPASKTGGRVSYSGSKTETINFHVHVDTDPFDAEVGQMKGHVDLLTGSVVATEAAHVKSIYDTTQKVGDTIINGFFTTIRSDISQQITELKTQSEALLLQLKKLAERVSDKKRQMGEDYRRLAERYTKIFTDLNNELENRIYSVDEPVFRAVKMLDGVGSLTGKEASVSTVSITSGEQAGVHAMIAANVAKRRAVNAVEKGKKFLAVQYEADRVLDKCLKPGGAPAMFSSPYCVMDAVDDPGVINRRVYASPMLGSVNKDSLGAKLDAAGWRNGISDDDVKAIGDYFNAGVAQAKHAAKNEHDRRVAELTAKLFNLSQTDVPKG